MDSHCLLRGLGSGIICSRSAQGSPPHKPHILLMTMHVFTCQSLDMARPAWGKLVAAGPAILRQDAESLGRWDATRGGRACSPVQGVRGRPCRAGLEGGWQGRPTPAELCGEGLQRRGVVGDAESVNLAGEHAIRRQLGDQGGQLVCRACTRQAISAVRRLTIHDEAIFSV